MIMTQMEDYYKKKYENAFKKAKDLHDNHALGMPFIYETCEQIFPELKESEDERIRKALIDFFLKQFDYASEEGTKERLKSWIAWLEKQGKQESVVVIPKFRVGDKIWHKNYKGECMHHIIRIETNNYIGDDNTKISISTADKEYELVEKQGEQKPAELDIQSTKKGDMLSNGTIVLIVDSIAEFEGKPIINSWYFADSEKFYGKGTSECDRWTVDGFRTATEAECNYLLKMMVDAGYEWDAEKKELKKIIDEKQIKKNLQDNSLRRMFEQKPVIDFSDIRTWKYIVDAVLTEKEGIGQYLDSPFTEKVAKKLQKRFGNIEQNPVEWSAYDKATLEYIIEDIKELCDNETEEGSIETYNRELNLLQAINKSIKLSSYTNPATWSEEDERIYNVVLELVTSWSNGTIGGCIIPPNTDRYIDWLKSLKERVKGE